MPLHFGRTNVLLRSLAAAAMSSVSATTRHLRCVALRVCARNSSLSLLFFLLSCKPITSRQPAYAMLQLFLDREGQRQAIKLQPCTGRASAAEAYAFQHSLALTRTVARQQARLLHPTSAPLVVSNPA